MFFNRNPKKTDRAQCLIEQYQQTVKKDSQKRRYYFSLLYSALFCNPSPQHIRYIGNEAKELMQGKDAFFVANVMQGYYADIAEADTDAWKQASSPDGYRALLIFGSSHPNGYFREYCLKLLANEHDALPFILLRMNDWVPTIRQTAISLLPEQLIRIQSCAELIHAMPCCLRVIRFGNLQLIIWRRTALTISGIVGSICRKCCWHLVTLAAQKTARIFAPT